MIILPVQKGHVAAKADARERGAGASAALGATGRMPFGRALQGNHASTFVANASRVPIDSADFAAGACASASKRHARAHAGRLAAPARG